MNTRNEPDHTSTTRLKIVSRKEFMKFVDNLIQEGSLEVHGVKSKGTKFVFGQLSSADELRLDYDVTILPPKKYFLPPYESMMRFDLFQPFSIEEKKERPRRVIIGVHPYDIVALQQMDAYYTNTHVDDLYLANRKATLIVGLNVVTVSKKAFFGDMGTGCGFWVRSHADRSWRQPSS
ncbi:MAG: hypothetical protein HXS40_09660 [Theionarchaea archaeon]|nr:hypothetical protein [Theionarchaea archaeon]